MIILTGFGPYGKYKVNLSSEVVTEFPFEYKGFQIIKEILPVSWNQSKIAYKNLLSKVNIKPELVILTGIHTGNKILLENLSWNFKFGNDIEKNFQLGPIKKSASPCIKSTLNLKELYARLENPIGISISYFPGLYLCNYIYYWALDLSKKEYLVVFIHIPDKGDKYEIIIKFKKIISTISELYLIANSYI